MAKKVFRRSWAVLMIALIVGALMVPQSAQAAARVHVVRPGETLWLIAVRNGTTVWAIARANGIRNVNYIWPGECLVIPFGWGGPPPWGGPVYIVRPGDTLLGIALRYGTTIHALAVANHIWNPSLIFVGQRLIITRGGPWGPPPRGGPWGPPPHW